MSEKKYWVPDEVLQLIGIAGFAAAYGGAVAIEARRRDRRNKKLDAMIKERPGIARRLERIEEYLRETSRIEEPSAEAKSPILNHEALAARAGNEKSGTRTIGEPIPSPAKRFWRFVFPSEWVLEED